MLLVPCLLIEQKPAASWREDSPTIGTAATCWCWDCPAAAYPWPARSRALNAELDVLIVRKLGLPYQPELAMGAIASGGGVSINQDVLAAAGVTSRQFEQVRAAEERELQRRERLFRGARAPIAVQGRTVIVVDDGLATGASMRAALAALRGLHPKRLVVAVPVAPADAGVRLADVCDEFVCLAAPPDFAAVGHYYDDFRQTTDDEVRALLGLASAA